MLGSLVNPWQIIHGFSSACTASVELSLIHVFTPMYNVLVLDYSPEGRETHGGLGPNTKVALCTDYYYDSLFP